MARLLIGVAVFTLALFAWSGCTGKTDTGSLRSSSTGLAGTVTSGDFPLGRPDSGESPVQSLTARGLPRVTLLQVRADSGLPVAALEEGAAGAAGGIDAVFEEPADSSGRFAAYVFYRKGLRIITELRTEKESVDLDHYLSDELPVLVDGRAQRRHMYSRVQVQGHAGVATGSFLQPVLEGSPHAAPAVVLWVVPADSPKGSTIVYTMMMPSGSLDDITDLAEHVSFE